METENTPQKGSRRMHLIIWTTAIFLAVGGAILFWFLVWGQFEESTEDSYVHGNMVQLNSQIPGIVTSINAEETQFVKKGQVVVELDRTDPEIYYERSKAELGDTVRHVLALYQNVNTLIAELGVKKADLYKATCDYENRVPLVKPGAVSKEDFEHAIAALEAAKSSLKVTKHELLAAYAQVQNTTLQTHPLVVKAADQVKEAFVNLRRCQILAPADGYVAMRNVQVGESVDVTTPLLAIVPLETLWVEANFKEIHLKNVRIGQQVTIWADLYGRSVKYYGKVTGLSAGTGSAFSVLPPQNATGNWIKIVQRLPVRVDLNPDELEKHPLMIGLSMHTHIDTHDRSGDLLAKGKPVLEPIYATDVYPRQELGVEGVIASIIKENSSPDLPTSVAAFNCAEIEALQE